jgi:hypothetical protein
MPAQLKTPVRRLISTRRGERRACSPFELILIFAALLIGASARSAEAEIVDLDGNASTIGSAESPLRQSPFTSSRTSVEVEETLAAKVPCPSPPASVGPVTAPQIAADSPTHTASCDASRTLQAVGTRLQI